MNSSYLKKATILVADDDSNVTELFSAILSRAGYNVVKTTCGGKVLPLAIESKPDAILLDVVFPETNGIDICKSLKENEDLAPVPVLLITGLSDRKNRIDGIKAGANDYLVKPLDKEEVLLRVGNAVRMKQLYDETQRNYLALKSQEELRDSLVHMIVHDLRVPMTVVDGALQFVEMMCDFAEDDPKKKMLKNGIRAATSLNEMVSSILDISKLEAGTLPVDSEMINIATLLEDVVANVSTSSSISKVVIVEPDNTLEACCDLSITRRILLNIIINGLRYNPQKETLEVQATKHSDHIRIEVRDKGPGIPEEHRSRIFSKFGQVVSGMTDKMRSMGLGLAFCKLAIEAQKGDIGVDSNGDKGCTFWFKLPLVQ